MTATLLVVLLAGRAAPGFVVVRDPNTQAPVVWSDPNVSMVIHAAGSDDVPGDADLTAIRSAMAVWSAATCSKLRFVDAGTSPTSGDAEDGVNRVSFLESNWPAGASGAVALTTRRRNTGSTPQTWKEVDVILNGQDFTWSVDGNVQNYDIQQTVTHELGHVLGLGHSPEPAASMYFGGRPGLTLWRTLSSDDRAGVCYLYPQAAFACSSDADCPLFQGLYGGSNGRTRCSAPNCVSGTVGYGLACLGNADCQSGLCLQGFDDAPASEPGFCTQTCSAGTCPGSDTCNPASGADRCYLGHDDCVLHADCPGGANHRCTMDLDGRFRCVYRCLTEANCASAAGSVCQGGTGANPPGFCRPPGSKSVGQACEQGLECQSLYCAGSGTQPTCNNEGELPDTGPLPDTGGEDGGPQSDTSATDGTPGSDPSDSLAPGSDPPEAALQGGCACGPGLANGSAGLLALAGLATRRGSRSRKQAP